MRSATGLYCAYSTHTYAAQTVHRRVHMQWQQRAQTVHRCVHRQWQQRAQGNGNNVPLQCTPAPYRGGHCLLAMPSARAGRLSHTQAAEWAHLSIHMSRIGAHAGGRRTRTWAGKRTIWHTIWRTIGRTIWRTILRTIWHTIWRMHDACEEHQLPSAGAQQGAVEFAVFGCPLKTSRRRKPQCESHRVSHVSVTP